MNAKESWRKEDRIRWVEWRLRERTTAEKEKEKDRTELDIDREHELDAAGVPPRLALEIWLAKDRDSQSWLQIVIKFLPQYAKAKVAGISHARRLHSTVQRALEPQGKKALKNHLDSRIRELFQCTPEAFKRYLNSISTRKPGK